MNLRWELSAIKIMEDIVGDIDEDEVCKWSEKDLIEDISEDIADKILEWLSSIQR